MTTLDNPASVTVPAGVPGDSTADVLRAAQAAAVQLPLGGPVQVGEPHPAIAVRLEDWSGAALARLTRVPEAWIGVLVKADLVDALAAAPMGPLDLGAAVQPGLDAAAAALGTAAAAAVTVEPADLPTTLAGALPSCHAVPLLSEAGPVAVLLVSPPTAPAAATPAAANPFGTATARSGIEMLHGVSMEVTVELGRTRMSVRELLSLAPGDVIELDRVAGSPADLLVNGRLIARGEVVVVDEDYALRVTEILPASTAS